MESSWLNLQGKVVIVTGGSSGIGRAIVEELADQGASVAVFDLASCDRTDGVSSFTTDITKGDAVAESVQAVVAHFGRIDGVVNCAGINLPRLIVDVRGERPEYELDEAAYAKVMDINVKGPYLVTQAALHPMVKAGKGVVVNITSEAGVEGSSGQSIYSASKGALNSFTRSWGKELGEHGIRVVGVAPGINEPTGLTSPAYNEALAYVRGAKDPSQLSTDYKKTIPLGRPGKLSEIANLVAFLVSDRASYITGTTYAVTGGKSRG